MYMPLLPLPGRATESKNRSRQVASVSCSFRGLSVSSPYNDRRMLKAARVGMAAPGKSCAVEALLAADVHVTGADIGLDLLLRPKRLKAALKF
jgi:hypothetical protein